MLTVDLHDTVSIREEVIGTKKKMQFLSLYWIQLYVAKGSKPCESYEKSSF
jgi:hypothetical protein